MKKIKIIQIGDIHWPEHSKLNLLDLKDKAFPSGVAKRIGMNPLQTSMRSVLEHCREDVTAILLCGDLTSFGDVNGYRHCIDYLKNNLLISCKDGPAMISIVPGNHDINRLNCDPAGINLFKKFEPLKESWRDISDDILPIEEVRTQNYCKDNCNCTVFSLNSCIGCGERRYLPGEISNELIDIFHKYGAAGDPSDTFKLLGETLDTPAFDVERINDICSIIKNISPKTLPIILSHHNILPQKMPRLSLYAEAINAGFIRSRFSRCKYPVIYCHGHIHQDPIEIVTQPDSSNSKLICIAAPEFKDGFNLMEIQYSDNNYPLGCIVTHLRLVDECSIEKKKEIRISFYGPQDIEQIGHARISKYMAHLSRNARRFPEVVSNIRKNEQSSIHESTIADVLLECEWMGLVQIFSREDDKRHWQIRGLI
jgi:hypothetical protein